jgi:hypothetical protein
MLSCTFSLSSRLVSLGGIVMISSLMSVMLRSSYPNLLPPSWSILYDSVLDSRTVTSATLIFGSGHRVRENIRLSAIFIGAQKMRRGKINPNRNRDFYLLMKRNRNVDKTIRKEQDRETNSEPEEAKLTVQFVPSI